MDEWRHEICYTIKLFETAPSIGIKSTPSKLNRWQYLHDKLLFSQHTHKTVSIFRYYSKHSSVVSTSIIGKYSIAGTLLIHYDC